MATTYHFLPEETQTEFKSVAEAVVAPGKGILAAVESVGTMGKRLRDIGFKNTEENRRFYRQLLFSTVGDHVSGVTLSHEILYKTAEDCSPLIDILRKIKIMTQGLYDLGPRCEQYKKGRSHFVKWPCVLKIGLNTPSLQAIIIHARYPLICEAYRILPIIEPEVLPDVNNILGPQKITEKMVLAAVFKAINKQYVFLEGTFLRPKCLRPQEESSKVKTSSEEIGKATVITLQRTVPSAVAGVVFLSGGQSEEEATNNLNAINKYSGKIPCTVTFSYGRALQAFVLRAWAGLVANVEAAQEELLKRTTADGEACLDTYEPGTASTQDLFVADHSY